VIHRIDLADVRRQICQIHLIRLVDGLVLVVLLEVSRQFRLALWLQ
jgi:hypothetical protein